ncbi:flagellar hook protein FlgE [Aquabacter sp. L1I39]|uniref:flagellar hook protein FlgE n=1 Tax=Aquabacter sp. L1I39 TaxID=2820278 RepID=UPI001ADCBD1E|nr:flagellar hook protein FlgE [Aquabacter sp. L1I39]QTL04311.1 flagellar hook protein FlgE [Aquabacter sp. L1I39]
MSLYGMLRTSVSGMTAQSNMLSNVSENIANTGTTGYKSVSSEFSSLLLSSSSTQYESGAVTTNTRQSISKQGGLAYTTSSTDLAIQGNGFFLVQDPSGQSLLTRAGAFQVDASTGNLVNSAGLTLMGYDIADGTPDVVLNGFGGLQPINFQNTKLEANASTSGAFAANLPANSAVETGDTPADNLATSAFTEKSSLVAFDNLGNKVTLDLYMTKTATAPGVWELAVFDRAQASASGGFPYGAGPLATQTMNFDTMGNLTSGDSISFTVPDGQPLTMDLSGMTQLSAGYTPLTATVNGNAPAAVQGVVIKSDGTVYATDANGRQSAIFKVPLAFVESPDRLAPLAGNAFTATVESGLVQVGFPEQVGLGSLVSGATEQSNVDMASELTKMIVAQRDYTANSKVFQTGTELLDVLMNLKR